MPGYRLRRNDQGLGFISTVLVLVITFAVVLGVYMTFFAYKPTTAVTPPKIAEIKDVVEIAYIGYFENGLVFDTSLESVANDDASWPKAMSFTARQSYENYTFQIGKTACASGETDCAIIGMSEAVLGRSEGDVITTVIPPEKGYGYRNPNLITRRNMMEQVSVRNIMNHSAFEQKYGSQPINNLLIADPFWGWDAIVHVTADMVIVENVPEISRAYPLYENNIRGGHWSAIVQNIDDAVNNGTGAITILNQLTFVGSSKLMVTLGQSKLYITENDDGTFTVDGNREVVGVNLVFQITIDSITKS